MGQIPVYARLISRPTFKKILVITLVVFVFLRGNFLKEVSLATTFDETTRQQVQAASEALWPVLRNLAIKAGNTRPARRGGSVRSTRSDRECGLGEPRIPPSLQNMAQQRAVRIRASA
jgi:hypothetical protein